VEQRAALEAKGWRVVTLWECELKGEQALEERLAALVTPTVAPPSSSPS
jgi:DNA mismatch endonuclease (patch repair protein)